MRQSNAEYVKSVLLMCPYIAPGPFDLAIDFLGECPTRYSIDAEPASQVVKHYWHGESLRRYAFALMARYDTVTDEERAANMRNYENLSLWLEEQKRYRRLPPMDGGAQDPQLLATGSCYLEARDDDANSAVYRMQLELVYIQKAR